MKLKSSFRHLKQFGSRITGTFKLPDDKDAGVHLFSVLFADDETGIGQLTSPKGVVSEFTLKPVDEWAREVNGHQHSKPTEKDDVGGFRKQKLRCRSELTMRIKKRVRKESRGCPIRNDRHRIKTNRSKSQIALQPSLSSDGLIPG